MKNYDRSIPVYCPVCGNTEYECLNDQYANYPDLSSAPDDVKLRCSDCKNIFTKGQLLAENEENIETVKDEMVQEFINDFEKDFQKKLNKIFK